MTKQLPVFRKYTCYSWFVHRSIPNKPGVNDGSISMPFIHSNEFQCLSDVVLVIDDVPRVRNFRIVVSCKGMIPYTTARNFVWSSISPNVQYM